MWTIIKAPMARRNVATSKNNIHLNTSAGIKLKAIAALDPNTATAADIINAAKDA